MDHHLQSAGTHLINEIQGLVDHLFQLIDAQHEGRPVYGRHQPAQIDNRAEGHVFLRTRDHVPDQLPVKPRQVLAAEPLIHPGADAAIVGQADNRGHQSLPASRQHAGASRLDDGGAAAARARFGSIIATPLTVANQSFPSFVFHATG